MADSVKKSEGEVDAKFITEKIIFDVGYGRAQVHAKELVNTSGIPTMNQQRVLVRGKKRDCGYYSNSTLEAYTRCPQQFKRRYIDKEKPRLMPKLKMWGGTAVHDSLEKLLTSKRDGGATDKGTFLKSIDNEISEHVTDYDQKFVKAKAKNEDPLPLDYGARIVRPEQFPALYRSAGEAFYDGEFQNIKPLEVEKMFIHNFEVNTGGTMPIVGFIDLIEELESGEKCVTDHKVGAARDVSEVKTSQQLGLYSFATKIPMTAINNFVLGTTGGKSGKNPKPGEFKKLSAKKTVQDYERVHDNVNQVLKGIKSGSFPRSGVRNRIVCAPNQCPFYKNCMG
jgi:RecB family exonuclease